MAETREDQSALLKELQDNEAAVKALEQTALDHEKAAREARAQREQLKHRQTELRSLVGAVAAANAAQDAAAAKAQAEAVVESLQAKEKTLDEKHAKLDELIEKVTAKLAESSTGS